MRPNLLLVAVPNNGRPCVESCLAPGALVLSDSAKGNEAFMARLQAQRSPTINGSGRFDGTTSPIGRILDAAPTTISSASNRSESHD